MKIRYLSNGEQSDYDDGCLEIFAGTPQEAFELGIIFADLVGLDADVVRYKSSGCDGQSIRIPLKQREKSEI